MLSYNLVFKDVEVLKKLRLETEKALEDVFANAEFPSKLTIKTKVKRMVLFINIIGLGRANVALCPQLEKE